MSAAGDDTLRHPPGSGGGRVQEASHLRRRQKEEARGLHSDEEQQASCGQPVLVGSDEERLRDLQKGRQAVRIPHAQILPESKIKDGGLDGELTSTAKVLVSCSDMDYLPRIKFQNTCNMYFSVPVLYTM